jgi:predicted TIM-barrel fold metal-dependent hydrolase
MEKIINAHSHLIELDAMYRKYGNLNIPAGISVLADLEATLRLLNPDVLIEQMDEAGVDQSILYAVDAPIVFSSNEYVSQMCERYPGRFIGFASVNPHAPDASATVAHAVRDLNLRGLKLHPPLQDFFPNSESVFPIYEKAIELNIPIVFHVGTTPFGPLCRLDRANPILLDDVATRFPSLRIMLTHLGTLWTDEAFMVVEKNPNVFIDTAAYLYEIPEVLTLDTIRRVGPERFVFGTDYPMPSAGKLHRIWDFVDVIKRICLPDNIERAIFSENCYRLLNGAVGEPVVGMSLGDLVAFRTTQKAESK